MLDFNRVVTSEQWDNMGYSEQCTIGGTDGYFEPEISIDEIHYMEMKRKKAIIAQYKKALEISNNNGTFETSKLIQQEIEKLTRGMKK